MFQNTDLSPIVSSDKDSTIDSPSTFFWKKRGHHLFTVNRFFGKKVNSLSIHHRPFFGKKGVTIDSLSIVFCKKKGSHHRFTVIHVWGTNKVITFMDNKNKKH